MKQIEAEQKKRKKRKIYQNIEKEEKEMKKESKVDLYPLFKNKDKSVYINSTAIGSYFGVSAQDINKIFLELEWIQKKDKWWTCTEHGINYGGREQYNPKNRQKYVVWKEDIVNNSILNKYVNDFKESKNKVKIAKTYKEKVYKGAMYEEYVADYFRNNGHTVWEHGKEKGVKDGGMDLFVKDGRNIYFVQCKNWENWKINLDKVQAIQTKIRNILKEKPQWFQLMKDYNMKIMYVAPKDCLTKGAYRYIKENNNILEFRKIEIK
jgi:Holliday junction resolvase-like predicted endonuclease